METKYQKQAKVFKALCDPKRLAILEQLRGGEKCACVLQGIVTSRQEGKWTHYQLSDSGREYAIELLKELTTPDTEQAIACHRCG